MFIFFTVIAIAVGLSMDTFSLSLSYGMFNNTKKQIIITSITVGIFHFIMPLLGNFSKKIIINEILINESLMIGIIFLILSISILVSNKNEDLKPFKNIKDIIIFSFAVSIDSFTTGIGLDAINFPNIFISTVFMITSGVFTYIGLMLGKKLHDKIGKKAEIVGISILLILSISYILKGC